MFPTAVVNNVLPVSTGRAVPFGTLAPVFPVPDQFQPFFEISTQFQLTQAQVEGEENVRLAPSFARLAASLIADAEDRLLFLGPGSIPPLLAAGVNVTNQPPAAIPPQFAAIPPGFVAEATSTAVGPDILTILAVGMAALNSRAQPGPYALFLPPAQYAATFAPQPGGLATQANCITVLATGGFYLVNRLPYRTGLLVSLGGEPTKIILGIDATTAFTNIDPQGNCQFRVFERIQLVVRDGRAFQRLQL